jgi:hypothetical protein
MDLNYWFAECSDQRWNESALGRDLETQIQSRILQKIRRNVQENDPPTAGDYYDFLALQNGVWVSPVGMCLEEESGQPWSWPTFMNHCERKLGNLGPTWKP